MSFKFGHDTSDSLDTHGEWGDIEEELAMLFQTVMKEPFVTCQYVSEHAMSKHAF